MIKPIIPLIPFILSLVFISFGSLAGYATEVSQEIINPLVEYKTKLTAANKKLEQLAASQESVKDQLVILNSSLESEKAASEDLKTKYDLYLDIARTDPDPEIFDMAKGVGSELTKSKEEITSIERSITQHEKKLVHISVETKIYRKKYDALLERENIQFNKSVTSIVKKQTDEFKKSKVVQGSAEEFCSREEIIGVCEKRARVFAERNALEKGATILINSSTTLKDFKLEEDVIKSQLQASLTEVEVNKSAVKSLKPLSFEVILSAKVNPKVSDDLLEQFKQHSSQLLEKYRFNSGLVDYQRSTLLANSAAVTPSAAVAIASDNAKKSPLTKIVEPKAVTAQDIRNTTRYKDELLVVLNLIKQNRYFAPRTNNAYAKLGRINDPKDDGVAKLYTQLKESAISHIDVLTNEERLDDAEDLLDDLESNYSMKRESNELAKNIANKKKEIKNRKVINSYLSDASKAINRNRYFSPRRKNAFYFYQAILKIDSNNQSAKEALDKLPQKILQSVDSMVRDDDLSDAIVLAEKALANFASDTTISFKLDELRRLETAEKKKQKRSISIGW